MSGRRPWTRRRGRRFGGPSPRGSPVGRARTGRRARLQPRRGPDRADPVPVRGPAGRPRRDDGGRHRDRASASTSSGTGPSGSRPPSSSTPTPPPGSPTTPPGWPETTSAAMSGRVDLADEPAHGDVRWSSPYEIDPTTVSMADKVALLEDWSGRLMVSDGVDHVAARVLAVVEDKHYADLSGTITTQRRVRIYPVVEAVAVDEGSGSFESMRTIAPPVGRGWEYTAGDGLGLGQPSSTPFPRSWPRRWPRRRWNRGPTTSSSIPPISGSPSTSRWAMPPSSTGPSATRPPTRGRPSPPSTSSGPSGTARRSCTWWGTGPRPTASPRSATTTRGWRPRVSTSSATASSSATNSTGGWRRRTASPGPTAAPSPTHPSTSPSNGWRTSLSSPPRDRDRGRPPTTSSRRVDRGVYVVGDKSWSIDMQRYNFQFTGQRFYRIDKGRLRGPAQRRRLPGPDHRLLGIARSRRGSVHLRPRRCLQLRQGPARPGRPGVPRLSLRALPRRQRPQRPGRGVPVSLGAGAGAGARHLTSPQEVVERALAASVAEGCVVIVEELSQAEVRFANNTTTTNGVRRDRRVAVVSFRAVGSDGVRGLRPVGRGRRLGKRRGRGHRPRPGL